MKTDAMQPLGRSVMSEREFIIFAAMLTALTALGIDIMLPAMPAIAKAYTLANINDQQAIVAVYMLGFAAGHLIFGPLADRFGRVRPLLAALLLVFLTSLAAAWAPEYSWLLVARLFQGLCSAGARVIAIAAIRDRFAGREHLAAEGEITRQRINPRQARRCPGIRVHFIKPAALALCGGREALRRLVPPAIVVGDYRVPARGVAVYAAEAVDHEPNRIALADVQRQVRILAFVVFALNVSRPDGAAAVMDARSNAVALEMGLMHAA